MDSEKALRQAIAAIKAGDNETGQQVLAQVINADPQNEAAWLMLASVVEEDKKRRCLERVLAINPGNGRAALELLQLQQAEPSVKPRQGESSKLVESVQCPKCGAPVDVTAGRESLHCTHCGAGLKITRGASGHAMATLDDIKADTSVLAIRVALQTLDEKLQQQEAELQALRTQRVDAAAALAERQRKASARGKASGRHLLLGLLLCAIALLYLTGLSLGDKWDWGCSGWAIGLAAVGILLLLGVFSRPIVPERDQALSVVAEQVGELDSRILKCMAEIERCRERRTALTRQMEGLTDQL